MWNEVYQTLFLFCSIQNRMSKLVFSCIKMSFHQLVSVLRPNLLLLRILAHSLRCIKKYLRIYFIIFLFLNKNLNTVKTNNILFKKENFINKLWSYLFFCTLEVKYMQKVKVTNILGRGEYMILSYLC